MMKSPEIFNLFEKGRRRFHFVGDETAGVLVALDLEGRIFTVLNGMVLNRVRSDAVLEQTGRDRYLNPGGDGLWPAPEGTDLGYQYSTGRWSVPAGISSARYRVTEAGKERVKVSADIDLINNRGLGMATVFSRDISLFPEKNGVSVVVVESVAYSGTKTLDRSECLLVPWTLCQFDSGPGCEVVFPLVASSAISDLYEPSDSKRCEDRNFWHTKTDGGLRYQIGLGSQVEWIEYRNPRKKIRVRRKALPVGPGLDYIDIADRPPDTTPLSTGIRYSVYSDPDLFMEIEAAGGSPVQITPGAISSLTVTTTYTQE
ncbi:MAG: DUF6786 family protein [Candidatus Omnitrophota bacterium]